jgi:hypothetical protein
MGHSSIPTERCLVLKVIQPLAGYITVALIATASAAPLADDFPLIGSYTQNVPCKGDGSDPSELQVRISPKEIASKVGVCTFLYTKRDGSSVEAQVECHFPAGPLMGDIIFKMQPDNTINFTDRNKNYRSVLYRCPK